MFACTCLRMHTYLLSRLNNSHLCKSGPNTACFSFEMLSFALTSKHLVSFLTRENPRNSSTVCLSFSLTSPGFSEIPLPHSKQEVSADRCTNGTVLCGMSPIVIGTKVS